MKLKRKLGISLILIIVILMSINVSLHAISQATCIFMLIEPGSRAGGMGHSYVSIAEGGFAAWWNPGGLAFIKKSDVGLMHSNWFGDLEDINDMYYEFLGYNQFLEGIGTVGFNVTYMTYGEQQAVDAQGNELENFTSYEIAIAGSYGTNLGSDWGLGVNIKGVISGLAPLIEGLDMTAEGLGYTFVIDIGTLKRNLIIPKLSFGATLQNLGPKMSYENSTNKQPMPTNLRVGFSYKIFDSKYNKLLVSADANKMLVDSDPDAGWIDGIFSSFTDGDFQYQLDTIIRNFGVEYKYYDLISLRLGYVQDVAGHLHGVSFGGGLSYEFSKGKNLAFDFALQPGGELLEGKKNKTFSLSLTF